MNYKMLKSLIFFIVFFCLGCLHSNHIILESKQKSVETGDEKDSHKILKPHEITFGVDPVKVNSTYLPELSYQDILQRRFGNLESYSIKRKTLVDIKLHSNGINCSEMHSLIATLWFCYRDHRPLVLSPDMIWLLICNGFARHVELNQENLRSKFVKHQGKKILKVKKNAFVKGKIDNDWEQVFEEFSLKIKAHVGQKLYNLMVKEFSTTQSTEKAAFAISLMDTVKSYFHYQVWTVCGIPSITLEGTSQDWEELVDRTKKLRQYDLEWWTQLLIPILNQFVEASKGKPDKAFWKNIFKEHGGSGGSKITGWILKFFPYIKSQNILKSMNNSSYYSLSPNYFTSGFSKVDFLWYYYNEVYNMQFLSGFVGISQNRITKALRPEIGWIVREKP